MTQRTQRFKLLGQLTLNLAEVENNQFNANEEDGATFNRLKIELEEWGLLELPVVVRENGKDRFLTGHHRAKAWAELGNATINASVIEVNGKPLTKEEEFNLVNNFNQVRGGLTLSNIKRVIRHHELDVTKLDIFKYPVTRILPNMEKAQQSATEAQRKARVRDMALRLAGKIAELILDDIDAAVVCFRVDDKPVAIVRVAAPPGHVHKNISLLKTCISNALALWVEESADISASQPEGAGVADEEPVISSKLEVT